jgi:hypothetical protein
MELERADGRDDHHRIGTQPRFAAFDVDKLFRAEIRAETRLGNDVFAEFERRLRGESLNCSRARYWQTVRHE